MTGRRDFLRYAAVGSAGGALALAGQAPIRVGILGTQHSHVRGKLQAMRDLPDFEVVGICENDAETRKTDQADALYKGVRWLTETELLGDPTITLVVVECKPWEAVPWGKKVIEAGKHLHLEKPPGNQWVPFRDLVEDARRRKLLLQTGYMWRWHDGINAAIEAAQKGWLGDVFMVRGTINSDRTPEGRALEAKFKGGSFFELGGHLLDRTVELLGRPKNVRSWLRHDTKIDDTLADNTLVVLDYDKAVAMISSSAHMYGSGDHRSFEVIGSDGSFLVYPERGTMRVAMRKPQGSYKSGWQDIQLPPQPRYVGDFKELARALKGGVPLKHSYEHELILQETLLRASGEMS